MEDEDGSLLRRKSPEPALQLVTVVNRQELIGGGRCIDLEQDDVGREMPASSRLRIAGVDEDPMKPRLEPIEVAQRRELTPHMDEGHLDGVLGQARVAEDPVGNEDAPVADLANQGAEGLLVALPCLIHDRSKHPRPLSSTPLGAVNEYE